jgi:hypothetical protein
MLQPTISCSKLGGPRLQDTCRAQGWIRCRSQLGVRGVGVGVGVGVRVRVGGLGLGFFFFKGWSVDT